MDAEEFRKTIGRTMKEVMDDEKIGGIAITDEYLKGKLKDELDAQETKSFSYKGDVFESDPKIAWDVRQRARQDAHKLRGDYPAEKHQISGLPSVVKVSMVMPGGSEVEMEEE
jgi:hypothetical protein